MRFDLTLASGWPYGGPHTPITQAAGRLRVAQGTPPTLSAGEKLIGQATAGGTTYYFISSRTRQMVKRAAVGAEGFVLDHYDPAAIRNHLQTVAEKLLAAAGPNPPYAVFSDSLEVYASDWTPNFLEEFRRRRGYDLTPYLAALATDIGPKTMAVRHDWGKTLSELADANYLTPIREFAARHGTRFRSQTYGIPPVTLSSNALVDLPEGEGAQWRQFTATRWAASASHLYGRPVTSSETWTWLHSPVFRATPLDMKAEADLHFLQGVNQLIGHGWPYSPPEAKEPGRRFYAAAVFNDHNPWWIVMPDITKYLQRVSWLLRQGQPANDVAVYLPTDDAFASFTLGHDSVNQAMDRLIGPKVIPQILDAGYNFDFIDDAAIAKVGVPYKILVLPGVERMPLETLQKILAVRRNCDCHAAGAVAGAGADGGGGYGEDSRTGEQAAGGGGRDETGGSAACGASAGCDGRAGDRVRTPARGGCGDLFPGKHEQPRGRNQGAVSRFGDRGLVVGPLYRGGQPRRGESDGDVAGALRIARGGVFA